MLIVISPAKTLDFESDASTSIHTEPELIDQSASLIKTLKKMAPQDIAKLMKLSDKLATLNFDRFQNWSKTPKKETVKQALLAFKGDVYTGLEADTFSTEEFRFAQKHLRILSGLYGVLRPLDLMQPYRLEMGTKLEVGKHRSLYEFWGDAITETLNSQLKKIKSKTLINLASNEYFDSVKTDKLNAQIITPIFKDWKSGKYKIISFYAKKARGMMSAYAIRQKITDPEALKGFDVAGYSFDEASSNASQWVFLRKDSE